MDKPFQFRLRTLLLVVVPVAFIALPVGWYVQRPMPPQPVTVSGTVTLDGAPLDDFAFIVFYPIERNGVVARGTTDKDGRLDMLSETGCFGALGVAPGSYKVAFEGE